MPQLQDYLLFTSLLLAALLQSVHISTAQELHFEAIPPRPPPAPRGLNWSRKRGPSTIIENGLPIKRNAPSLPAKNLSDWDAMFEDASLELNWTPHESDTDIQKKLKLCNKLSTSLCKENTIKALAEFPNYDIRKLRKEVKRSIAQRGWNNKHLAVVATIILTMIRLNMKRLGDSAMIHCLKRCDTEELNGLIKYFGGRALGNPALGEITLEQKDVATALVDDITLMLQIVFAF